MAGVDSPPRNPVFVIATELAADGGNRFLLALPVGRQGEIGIRFDRVRRKRQRGNGLAFDDLAAALRSEGVTDRELAEVASTHSMEIVGPPSERYV